MTQSTIISRPTKLLKIIAMSLAIAAGTLNGIAQISGTVVDTEDNPLEGIAVVMMQSPDSLFISGTMTDINGHFSFSGNSLPEKAILRAEGIGYRKTDTTAVRGTACRLMLENSDLKLGEVTVTPPSLQVSPGKFTFYPGDIASYADNGFSLLEYAPLLRISDRTDVVSIIGKENTTVFINGKEPIGGDYAAIKLLQAADPSRIKRVEIIVQPGIADSEHESIVNVIMTPLKGNLVTSDVLLHYMNDRLSSRQQVFYYGEYDRWQFSASFHANESREKRNSHSSYTTYGESSSLPYDLVRINDATETSDRNWFSADVGSNLDLGHRNSVGMNLRLNMYQTKVSSNVFSLYQPSGSSQETFEQTHKPYKPFGSVTLNYDHDLDSSGAISGQKQLSILMKRRNRRIIIRNHRFWLTECHFQKNQSSSKRHGTKCSMTSCRSSSAQKHIMTGSTTGCLRATIQPSRPTCPSLTTSVICRVMLTSSDR